LTHSPSFLIIKIQPTNHNITMQLDFIGTTQNNGIEQSVFWDNDFNSIPTRRPSYNPAKVESFFNSLDSTEIKTYTDYWKSVEPKGTSEVFKRWLFAFMSVHTSWKSNISGYLAIRNWWEWLNNDQELENRIIASGAGLHKNRTRFISTFAKDYWANTEAFQKSEDETWVAYRDRLVKRVLGLGMAKVSFSLEMMFPAEADVTCLDTHLFQVYGLDQTKDGKQYHAIERHWIEMCKMWNVSPYVARCIWWDRNQGYTDSRYWSFVLE
jgi:thermostable 8-oxoguanine DNA glycosylase